MKKKVENDLLNSLILELRGKYLLVKEENKKKRSYTFKPRVKVRRMAQDSKL